MKSKLLVKGKWHIQFIENNKVIRDIVVPNGIVDAGMNHILETQFNGGTPLTAWYIGLINNSGYTALADSDTMASHAGWTEFASYDEATRQEWTAGTASARQITNATPVDLTISASGNVKGLFIVGGTGAATKSAATGTLWATAAFATVYPVADGTVLRLTYVVSG